MAAVVAELSRGVEAAAAQAWQLLSGIGGGLAFMVPYFLVFFGAATLVLSRRKKAKSPFWKEGIRFQRTAGFSLREEIAKREERIMTFAIRGLLLPLGVGTVVWLIGVVVVGGGVVSPGWARALPWMALAAWGLAIADQGRRFAAEAAKISDYRLGFQGERYVGEVLAPLAQRGWHIFHDVPCPLGNIDHVIVGRGGVFVIETKTWRKRTAGGAKNGGAIAFDGQDLSGPNGIDNRPLEQAEANSQWLTKALKEQTGLRVHVTPIVTFPLWFVEIVPRPRGRTRLGRVWNPKWIPSNISGERETLTDETAAAVADVVRRWCQVEEA